MAKFEKTQYQGIYKRIDNGIFYWRETIEGKENFKSTKSRKITEAKVIVRKWRQDISDGLVLTKKKITDVLDLGLDYYQNGDSAPKTIKYAERADKLLREYFKNSIVYLDSFEKNYRSFWAKYKKHAYERNMNNIGRMGNIDHEAGYFSFCLRLANQRGWCRKSFSKSDFPFKTYEKKAGRYVESHEIKALLDACLGRFYSEIRIEAGYLMGTRKTEFNLIELNHFIFEGNGDLSIWIPAENTKIRKERTVPVPHSIKEKLLEAYRRSRKEGGRYLIPQIRFPKGCTPEGVADYQKAGTQWDYTWRKIKKRAGVKCRFHDLKYTCSTNLINSGVPTPIVAQYVGTSEEVLNEIYIQTTKNSESIFRNALKSVTNP